MSPPAGWSDELHTSASANIRIAPITDLDDLARCVEIQLAVWGYSDGDVVPRRVFVVARAIGGQVIGAWAGRELIGFAMALPGFRDGHAYLHSHMLAVLPQHRNAGLGRRLKLAQREDALARGIDRMEWTFDPLEIKNAHLNIARLGAIARRYLPDFYGPSSSVLQGSIPTDRLVAEWWLNSARVQRILGENSAAQPGNKAHTSDAMVEQIDVPSAVYDWKQNPEQRTLAEQLQTRNRLALQAAFARGLAVTGYRRTPEGDGCFLLGPVTGIP